MKSRFLLLLILLSSRLIAQPICNWAYIPTGPTQSYNTIYISTSDHSGNVVEVGQLLGVGDMDPGSGPGDTLYTTFTYNYYVSKTTGNGQLLWVKYFNSNTQIGQFQFKGLKINSANEIVILGNYFGLVDFDLSANGVDTIRSHFATYADYFVAKYDSMGDYKWAISIGDPTTSNITSQALALMPNDNIIVCANPTGTVDVDPGTNVHNSLGGNANIICYDTDGNYVWNNHIAVQFSYGITNNSVDCDLDGNTYLINVGYYELTVSKFSITGAHLWDRTIGDFASNSRVDPKSVLVDRSNGDFYIVGSFGGTVDFDPSAPLVNHISSSGFYQDGFIAKYDNDMNLLWVNPYVGKVAFGNYSLCFDNSDIVAVGNFQGSVNFGAGANFSTSLSYGPFYLKLNTAGVLQTGFTLDGPCNFNSVSASPNNTFAITGYMSGTTDMDPSFSNLFLSTSVSNHFTVVYQNSITSSISEINTKDKFNVFPNPASDKVELITSKSNIGLDFRIYNVTGEVITTGKIMNERTIIHLKELAAGLYFIELGSAEKQVLKLIKND